MAVVHFTTGGWNTATVVVAQTNTWQVTNTGTVSVYFRLNQAEWKLRVGEQFTWTVQAGDTLIAYPCLDTTVTVVKL